MATNKYITTFTAYPMVFVATYSAGKIKQILYKRGKFNLEQWLKITKAIPLLEKDIEAIPKRFKGTVKMEKVLREVSEYQKWLDVYLEWHSTACGFPAKMDGIQGKALKSIQKYLIENSANNEEALLVWGSVLNNWPNYEEYYQKQTKLNQINSNLQLLIKSLKDDTVNNLNGSNRPVV